jgi:hypothetical protein
VAVDEWYRNISKEWSHPEAPKKMAAMYKLGEYMCEPAVA